MINLHSSYFLSDCLSGLYYAPVVDTIQEYRDYIDGFPLIDEPEIFGMHENANIAYQVKYSWNLCNTNTYFVVTLYCIHNCE